MDPALTHRLKGNALENVVGNANCLDASASPKGMYSSPSRTPLVPTPNCTF